MQTKEAEWFNVTVGQATTDYSFYSAKSFKDHRERLFESWGSINDVDRISVVSGGSFIIVCAKQY